MWATVTYGRIGQIGSLHQSSNTSYKQQKFLPNYKPLTYCKFSHKFQMKIINILSLQFSYKSVSLSFGMGYSPDTSYNENYWLFLLFKLFLKLYPYILYYLSKPCPTRQPREREKKVTTCKGSNFAPFSSPWCIILF